MLFYKQSIGKLGENAAAKFLRKKEYRILKRNFRNYYGEIDIIARDNNYTVFVEVKTRTSLDFGYPAEAVNFNKQHKIIKGSQTFPGLKQNSCIRYDIIEVYMNKNENKIEKINHIKNAFGA